MGVPRGWTLDDRREPVPRLFRSDVASVGSPSPAVSPPVRRRVERGQAAEQLRLDTGDELPIEASPRSDSVTEPEVDGPHDTDHHHVAPWVPQFDQRDDLHGLLDATGPLLSRAFGGRARPDH